MHTYKNDRFTDRVAVVIPIYKNYLESFEELALDQCLKVLGRHKIFVIKPRSLKPDILDGREDINYVSFDDNYFRSRQGYNELMLWEGFYKEFLHFEYMLIYQLDAYVFKDSLLEWCEKGYDYIGAPWLRSHAYIDIFKAIKSKVLIKIHTWFNLKQPGSDLSTEIQFENKVGNGGLSLRKVKKFYDACMRHKTQLKRYANRTETCFNEDVWWGVGLNRKLNNLKIPGYKKAVFFSVEHHPERAFELTGGQLPFGCHAWNLHLDFWGKHFVLDALFKQKIKQRMHIASLNHEVIEQGQISELSLVPKSQAV